MGEEYPLLHVNGWGAVLRSRSKSESGLVARLLRCRVFMYWVDQHYFYPLRTEQYGPNGELMVISKIAIAALYNPDLKERGYHNLITYLVERCSSIFSRFRRS